MASNDEKPTTAAEAAVAPEANTPSAAADTNGTTSLVEDIAMTAASVTSSVAPTPGTSTPFELDERQRRASLNVSLADLCAKATAQYVQKKFEDAADVFSRATEMQAEMNGETNPENAEILFLYGRALYEVGRSRSDVLGGKVPATGQEGAKKTAKKANAAKKETATAGAEPEKIIEKAVAGAAAESSEAKADEAEKKPLFQFEGDENFEGSDDEDEDDEEGDGEVEEDDAFADAFEILDLSRVLFTKKLEKLQAGPQQLDTEEGKGKEASEGESPAVKHIKERLGEAHDLLGEISLENENYSLAMKDFRASLNYRQGLFPEESEYVAESHYKLSLALEYESNNQNMGNAEAENEKSFDQGLRDEAVKQQQAAIDSTRKKLQAKEVDLATVHSPEDNDITKNEINLAREVLADMEQRLVDLKKPPMDVKAAMNEAAKNALGGLFGSTAGVSSAQIEEAKKTATDLSGLVRKKAKEETNGSAKRKAEEPLNAEGETEPKKTKVDEGTA